jgi:hypothetical protein
MGTSIGRRLADPIRRGPIPFFTTFLAQILRNSPIRRASNVAQWATHQWVTRRLVAHLPDYLTEQLSAMAEAVDLREESVGRAWTLPETYLWMIGSYHRLRGTERATGLGHPPIGGCTSAVVTPPAASTLLHGRNLDYYGIGYWEPTTTVTFYHPDDALDYVSVGAAGLLGGGITGMNAAGITLAVHQHVVDTFDLEGDPVGTAGDRVMRRARTLDEAIEILRRHDPVAGWSYVLTEGDTGEVALVETAPERDPYVYRLPDEETHFGYSNVYWGEEFEDAEIDYYPEYHRNARARQSRVLDQTSQFSAEGDRADPEAVASILGDFTDPTRNKTRLVGRSIASVATVASVVFEPAERRVWVGSGPSPASRSWFVPFSLESSDRPGQGGPDRDVQPFHPHPEWTTRAHGQAFDLYRQACLRFREGESDKRLMILIEHALALYPDDPDLHLLAGLLALRLDRSRRAEGSFRRALERVTDLTRRAEIELYLGWALDLQDERASARQMYREVRRAPSADPVVQQRARRALWIPFSTSKAEQLPLDPIQVGVP